MIRQDDNDLIDMIREYGCGMMCACFLVNKYQNIRFDRGRINKLYFDLNREGIIDKECTILSWDLLFDFLGLQVSARHDHKDYVCDDNELEILQFKNGNYKHFVVGDGAGNVAYDPLGDSRTVRFGELIGKRIFKL